MYEYLFNELDDVEFTNPVHAEILSEYKSLLGAGKVVDAQYFIDYGSPEVRKAVIDIVHDRHQISTNWLDKYKISIPSETKAYKLKQVAYTNVLRLKQRVVRKLIADNLEKIKETQDNDEQARLQQVHHELKQAEKAIAIELGNVILK